MIRLMIAASSAVTRAGLETLVASSPDVELVGSFPDLAAIEELHPDVVLSAVSLDDFSPPVNGRIPGIVLLTNQPQPVWTQEALRLGVRAVLSRDASAEEIIAAVEAAASGLAVIEPRDLEVLLSVSTPSQAIPVQGIGEPSPLTARELEVLRMIAEGAANKAIAWKLDISEHTVKFHVASILGKLHAASRTEAVTMGIRQGLIFL